MEPISVLSGGVDWKGAISSGGLVIFYLVFFVLVGVVMWAFYYYFVKYNQKILIYQALGSTWVIHSDRACVSRKRGDNGQPFLNLLKFKKELPPVSRKEYGLARTIFGRNDCLMFYTVDDFKTLLPVRFNQVSETKVLEVLDDWNASMLHLNEHKRQEQKFQEVSAWSKYAPFVLPIITLVICFAMVIITLKYVQDISGNANSAASLLSEAIRTYKGVPTPSG